MTPKEIINSILAELDQHTEAFARITELNEQIAVLTAEIAALQGNIANWPAVSDLYTQLGTALASVYGAVPPAPPVVVPPSPPSPPSPPVVAGWVPFAPLSGVIYPDTFKEDRWGFPFGVSNWDEPKFANGPWLYEHVIENADGTVTLRTNPSGNGQLQHHSGYTSNARVGALVKFGNIRPDSITTPVWMFSNYNQGADGSGRFELDFEVAGKRGLEVNYHDGIKPGKNIHFVPGDFSGRTVRFEIDYDNAGGFADFIVDGALVHRLTRAEVESYGMKWPIRGLFPIYDVWLVNNPGWTGAPYNGADATTMDVTLIERLYNKRD